MRVKVVASENWRNVGLNVGKIFVVSLRNMFDFTKKFNQR